MRPLFKKQVYLVASPIREDGQKHFIPTANGKPLKTGQLVKYKGREYTVKNIEPDGSTTLFFGTGERMSIATVMPFEIEGGILKIVK